MVPLYGFVQGDTMGVLVLAHREMTIAEVAAKLVDAASVRVDPNQGAWSLFARGHELETDKTVGQLELDVFERIDLRRRDAP